MVKTKQEDFFHMVDTLIKSDWKAQPCYIVGLSDELSNEESLFDLASSLLRNKSIGILTMVDTSLQKQDFSHSLIEKHVEFCSSDREKTSLLFIRNPNENHIDIILDKMYNNYSLQRTIVVFVDYDHYPQFLKNRIHEL